MHPNACFPDVAIANYPTRNPGRQSSMLQGLDTFPFIMKVMDYRSQKLLRGSMEYEGILWTKLSTPLYISKLCG